MFGCTPSRPRNSSLRLSKNIFVKSLSSVDLGVILVKSLVIRGSVDLGVILLVPAIGTTGFFAGANIGILAPVRVTTS